jgi:antitoxin component of RelBE/YafQ-DinJ toxin-antitoxin module
MPTKPQKDAAMNFRVPESLRSACEAAAANRGLDLSSWLRMVLTDAVRSK